MAFLPKGEGKTVSKWGRERLWKREALFTLVSRCFLKSSFISCLLKDNTTEQRSNTLQITSHLHFLLPEFSACLFVGHLAHGSPMLMGTYRPQYIININAVLPHLCYVFCVMELLSWPGKWLKCLLSSLFLFPAKAVLVSPLSSSGRVLWTWISSAIAPVGQRSPTSVICIAVWGRFHGLSTSGATKAIYALGSRMHSSLHPAVPHISSQNRNPACGPTCLSRSPPQLPLLFTKLAFKPEMSAEMTFVPEGLSLSRCSSPWRLRRGAAAGYRGALGRTASGERALRFPLWCHSSPVRWEV